MNSLLIRVGNINVSSQSHVALWLSGSEFMIDSRGAACGYV